jgi:hypothetical protein
VHIIQSVQTVVSYLYTYCTPFIQNLSGKFFIIRLLLKSFIFWAITLCSPLRVNSRFGGTCRLHRQGHRITHARNQSEAGSKQSSAYSLTLKMEATYSSETSDDFQWTTWHYIPEDKTLHNHCCKNLRSYKVTFVLFFFTLKILWHDRKSKSWSLICSRSIHCLAVSRANPWQPHMNTTTNPQQPHMHTTGMELLGAVFSCQSQDYSRDTATWKDTSSKWD